MMSSNSMVSSISRTVSKPTSVTSLFLFPQNLAGVSSKSVPTRKANQANAGTATAAHAPADQETNGPMVCQSDFKTCFPLFRLLQLCTQVLSPFALRTILARIGACWPYTCDGLAIDLTYESQTLIILRSKDNEIGVMLHYPPSICFPVIAKFISFTHEFLEILCPGVKL